MSNAVTDLFSNELLRKVLVRSRYFLVPLLLVPVARYMRPELFWVGFAVSMFGQLIQTWCFASLVKNLELTIRGPYLLCRNPMYVGRYFMILGFVILLGSVWVGVGYTVLYYLYMDARVRREEKRLARIFGEDYATYTSEVPRFFPSFRKAGEPNLWYWDWAPFFRNNAHWNILGTLLAFAVVYALHRWGMAYL